MSSFTTASTKPPSTRCPPPLPSRQPLYHSDSSCADLYSSCSAHSSCANPNEDWTKMSNLEERRRVQNRIAQRNYRKKLKRRREDERRNKNDRLMEQTDRLDGELPDNTRTDVPLRKKPPREWSADTVDGFTLSPLAEAQRWEPNLDGRAWESAQVSAPPRQVTLPPLTNLLATGGNHSQTWEMQPIAVATNTGLNYTTAARNPCTFSENRSSGEQIPRSELDPRFGNTRDALPPPRDIAGYKPVLPPTLPPPMRTLDPQASEWVGSYKVS